MRIACAESEKEDAKQQLHTVREERDKLKDDLRQLTLQVEALSSQEEQRAAECNKAIIDRDQESKLATLAAHCTVSL